MKLTVTVRLKDGVLDPQGQAIAQSLSRMGYDFVNDVRVGKIFEIELENTDNLDEKVREFSAKMLANPIIETFSISTEAGK